MRADPESYLRVWGRVRSGLGADVSSLTELERMSGVLAGAPRSLVEVCLVAAYVEDTDGFARARPALEWIYCDGGLASEFRVMRPGEDVLAACIRLQWLQHVELPAPSICEAVRTEFSAELLGRLEVLPLAMWTGPRQVRLGCSIAAMEAVSGGPVTPTEREQIALIRGIRAAEKRGDAEAIDRMAARLGDLRSRAAKLTAA